MSHIIVTKRDLLLALADVPEDAEILVPDAHYRYFTNLTHPRAELNIVPTLDDPSGIVPKSPKRESVRVIFVSNDRHTPAWDAGTTRVLQFPDV